MSREIRVCSMGTAWRTDLKDLGKVMEEIAKNTAARREDTTLTPNPKPERSK